MSTSTILTLKSYYRQYRQAPSVRQFCELLGKPHSYRTQARRIMERLVDSGYLTKVEHGRYAPGPKLVSVPIYNSVQAGKFTAAETEVVDVELDKLLLPRPEQNLLITVSGDSMVEAGISDGDIVIVEKGDNYYVGDIIVVELNGEFTVKYYQRNQQNIPFLQPANSNYQPIYFQDHDQVHIIGKVIKAIKNFD